MYFDIPCTELPEYVERQNSTSCVNLLFSTHRIFNTSFTNGRPYGVLGIRFFLHVE